MRGDMQVRFGGRAGETDREKLRHRAPVRPITYVPTWSGMVYVAFCIDVYSRMIVGWNLATNMRTELVMTALEHAIWRRDTILEELIAHSDAGSQPGLKGSSQHRPAGWRVEGRRGPLPGFSIRGSCGAGC